MRSRRPTAVIVLLAALLCGACGQQAPARDPASRSDARVVGSGSAGLDPTARAFVELSIATGDQAVKLMDLGASWAADPKLRAFASGLASVRRAEVAELHGLLGRVPYVNLHEGHDMPGMPTEAELVALAAAGDFDVEFVRLARAHLTESSTVVRSGLPSIKDERTRAVASAMEWERESALRSLDTIS